MSINALKEIDFNGYFSLLRQGLPATVGLWICDASGRILVADAGNPAQLLVAGAGIDSISRQCLSSGASRTMFSNSAGVDFCTIQIRDPAGEIAGFLVVIGKVMVDPGCEHDNGTRKLLEAVIVCIEREIGRLLELNAMAVELTARYEELNLVYDTKDEIAGLEEEEVTIRQLLENYVTYLDVDIVLLLYPGKDEILSASASHDMSREPAEILRALDAGFLSLLYQSRDYIILNGEDAPLRAELSFNMPYKLMSCPVLNPRGEVDAVLVCLNQMQRPDYFNSDRSLLKVMARKVEKISQANYDALTGLMNRHAFELVLKQTMRHFNRSGYTHCVLNIDIDQLQVLNDSYGREAGDVVIKSVGEVLLHKLRNTDVVSYLGEGRYGVLLVQCGVEQAQRVAQGLREQLKRTPVRWNDEPVDIQVSTGIALIEQGNLEASQVMEAAELARMAAKEQGNGQIRMFRQDDKELVARKSSFYRVSQLQKALRENRFRLFCQTIQPAKESAEHYHLEILVRMIGEDQRIITPDQFIPVAEKFNLMPVLDRWIIDAAFSSLATAALANVAGQGVVAINLSGQSLADGDLALFIEDKLRYYAIAPSCICFEVTETAAIHNKQTALQIINHIKSLGCHLSLDDFGTGLSSFSYLKELPVDYIKIDGSFVKQVLEDKVSHVMVASVIQIGQVMGLKTIAEYVENERIAQHLSQMGVDYLQGYGIDKPQPLTEYLSRLGGLAAAQAAG